MRKNNETNDNPKTMIRNPQMRNSYGKKRNPLEEVHERQLSTRETKLLLAV